MEHKGIVKHVIGALLMCLAVQAQAASEYHVKAAIMYNLARMVEWPNTNLATASKPFPICFLGDEPFGDALDFIRSKKIQNRPLEFHKEIQLDEAEKCAILYISASEEHHLEEVLRQVGNLPLLTVSDHEGFAERGVVVNLMRGKKKVRMELNAKAAERANLAVSPALKKLAVGVEDKFVP